MSNDYFDTGDYTALTRQTLARAEAVNAIFAAIVAGFDVLPSAAYIKEGRIGFAVDSGAADHYIVDQNVRPSGYNNGLTVVYVASATNTGACDINVKGSSGSLLGVKSIKRPDGTDPGAGDIPSGAVIVLIYYGSTFQILAPISAAAILAQAAAAASAAAAAVSASDSASSAGASALSALAALASQVAAAASAASAAASAAAAQHVYAGTLDGSSPNHQVSSATLAAGAAGITFDFIAGATNSGAMLLDIGATTNIALKDADGTALPAGAVVSGRRYAGVFTAAAVARIAEIDASQTTATTGTDNVARMTALRVLQSIQANAITQGLHTINLEGRAFTPRTTNGASASSTETGTNKVMIVGLAFDKDTAQYAQARFVMPKSWNGGTVTARIRWTAASGSGSVIWGVQAVALRDNVAIDTAFGTARTVTDALQTASYEHVTSTTAAITIANSPVAQDTIVLQVYRDAAAGGDDLSASAILLSVEVFYTVNAGNDA